MLPLAELRNGIRHSRSADRKEGEATLLWFKQVLSQQVLVARSGSGIPRGWQVMTNGNGLSGLQIHKVVDQYVGVTAGNLTGFSHRGLQEFYSGYCGLDVDLSKYVGNTKREIFLAVLKEARPHEQATILRALVERILPTGLGAPMTRTESLRDEILSMAGMLETTMVVPAPTLKAASEVVQRALTDAQVLLDNSDAISAIDRIHTA